METQRSRTYLLQTRIANRMTDILHTRNSCIKCRLGVVRDPVRDERQRRDSAAETGSEDEDAFKKSWS
jgi:hypothetical protein